MFITWPYQFNTNTSEPPTSSQIRLNNSDQTLATKLWIMYSNSDGMDVREVIKTFGAEGECVLQDWDDATRIERYNVTGPATDKGNYAELPVEWLSGGTSNIVGQKVVFAYRFPGLGTLPVGGAPEDLLVKATATNFDAKWRPQPTAMTLPPSGGSTYDPTLATKKDQLRFMIGDTKDPFYFTDEELNAVLMRTDPEYPPGDPEKGNVYQAALLCALSGMARSRGSSASRSIGPMSISDESFDRWSTLYDMLVRTGPDGLGGMGIGRKAVPVAFGYQAIRREYGVARPLHARIAIHDYAYDYYIEDQDLERTMER
jgi:hypothetical protein